MLNVFATGLGPVEPKVATGVPGPSSDLFRTPLLPEVRIAGVPVPVFFSGIAPNFAGLYQINIRVPEEVPSGAAVPLVLRIGNLTSSMTIAIE